MPPPTAPIPMGQPGALRAGLERSLAGLPAFQALGKDESAASPQKDSHNLELIAERLSRLWGDVRIIRQVVASGAGRGGMGGGNLSMYGLPNSPLGRVAHFMHGIGNVSGGIRGLAAGNPAGAIMGVRGAAMLASGAGGLGAAGAAVAAVAAPIAAIAAVVGFTLAIKAAADELIKANHELAKFSPAMAQVFAQRDVQEIFRERDRGNALAPSASMLVREEQRYRDAIFPMETAWEELKNNFLAGFYSELADIAEGVRGLAEMVGIELKHRNAAGSSDTFSGQINKIADKAASRQLDATRAAVAASRAAHRAARRGEM
jgi:hypothetical protein